MTTYELKKLARNDTQENRAKLRKQIAKAGATAEKKIERLKNYEQKAGSARAHSFALDKLKGDMESLGIKKPTESAGETTADLARQLSAIQSFNEAKTSTIGGIKEQESNLRRVLRDADIAIPRGKNWDLLLEVFSSEAFAEFETWGSERRFKIATMAVKKGVTAETLNTIMEEYRKGRQSEGKRATLDTLWKEHVGFNPFLV